MGVHIGYCCYYL